MEKNQEKWAAAHPGQDRRLSGVVTHSRSCGRPVFDLGWGPSSKTAPGSLSTGSPAGRTPPPHGDGSMYCQANVRAGKVLRTLPSGAVRDRGHWKGVAGSCGPVEMRLHRESASGGKVIALGCASKPSRSWPGARRSQGCESRNNHRYAVVVQDLATQWIQAYPCKNKTSQETQRSLQKFLEPERKPKVIYTDNSLEFGKACEDLSWNNCTSTPHRSETNVIAERAVRRVKEGTSDNARTLPGFYFIDPKTAYIQASHLWPELWKSMGKNTKLKEKQKWSNEELHLDRTKITWDLFHRPRGYGIQGNHQERA